MNKVLQKILTKLDHWGQCFSFQLVINAVGTGIYNHSFETDEEYYKQICTFKRLVFNLYSSNIIPDKETKALFRRIKKFRPYNLQRQLEILYSELIDIRKQLGYHAVHYRTFFVLLTLILMLIGMLYMVRYTRMP